MGGLGGWGGLLEVYFFGKANINIIPSRSSPPPQPRCPRSSRGGPRCGSHRGRSPSSCLRLRPWRPPCHGRCRTCGRSHGRHPCPWSCAWHPCASYRCRAGATGCVGGGVRFGRGGERSWCQKRPWTHLLAGLDNLHHGLGLGSSLLALANSDRGRALVLVVRRIEGSEEVRLRG